MFTATIFHLYLYKKLLAELSAFMPPKFEPIISIMEKIPPRHIAPDDMVFNNEDEARKLVFAEFIVTCKKLKFIELL